MIKKKVLRYSTILILLTLLILIIATLCFFILPHFRSAAKIRPAPVTFSPPATEATTATTVTDQEVIRGHYADPDVLQKSDGDWRLYFGTEPESTQGASTVYSAHSSDGVKWTLLQSSILTEASFPDAVLLSDGRIRLYFQRAREIDSAISSDGVNFTLEAGVRQSGHTGTEDSDGVAAPSVATLPDGTFLMAYRADVQGAYGPSSINKTTTSLFVASSGDGITWNKGSLVVDGRSTIFDGYVDGPEIFFTKDGLLHLRFWSPGARTSSPQSNQYDLVSTDQGKTWSKPLPFLSDILGGDPTYAVTDQGIYLFYTRHGEGIYLRILK